MFHEHLNFITAALLIYSLRQTLGATVFTLLFLVKMAAVLYWLRLSGPQPPVPSHTQVWRQVYETKMKIQHQTYSNEKLSGAVYLCHLD